VTPERHTLVFLCVANAARSQMAEGLARASAPPGWSVFSAGSSPGTLNPLAVAALREVGIDISHHRSKGLDDVPYADADVVITLCAEEVCPVVPARVRRLHWPLPDPARFAGTEAERLAAFRKVRDDLARRIAAFWSTAAT
jgi:thioredoxin type arsenate reductase